MLSGKGTTSILSPALEIGESQPVDGAPWKHGSPQRPDAARHDERRRRAMHLRIVQDEIAFLADAWHADPRLDKATIRALALDLLRRSL